MNLYDFETASPNDTLDARGERIRQRLLDGIEATLDELALPEMQRAAIEHAVRARIAPLLCRQVTCRRARRCRRNPCTVREMASAAKKSAQQA